MNNEPVTPAQLQVIREAAAQRCAMLRYLADKLRDPHYMSMLPCNRSAMRDIVADTLMQIAGEP